MYQAKYFVTVYALTVHTCTTCTVWKAQNILIFYYTILPFKNYCQYFKSRLRTYRSPCLMLIKPFGKSCRQTLPKTPFSSNNLFFPFDLRLERTSPAWNWLQFCKSYKKKLKVNFTVINKIQVRYNRTTHWLHGYCVHDYVVQCVLNFFFQFFETGFFFKLRE